jgi:hypothetical protein
MIEVKLLDLMPNDALEIVRELRQKAKVQIIRTTKGST